MSKRIAKSLKLQLFCAALISLAVAALVFCTAFFLGDTLLDETVYGHAFAERMADRQFSKLQGFVEEERVSLNSLQRLNVWCSRGEKVYLTIYKDDILVYEAPFSGNVKRELDTASYDPGLEDPVSEHALILADGTEVRAFLYYYAGDDFFFWMIALAGIVAFAAFSICFVLLINRKVEYISQLKQELDILSSGQLEYAVTISGSDELSELALGIDQMRRSIVKHQAIEDHMGSANSELITAMSHDLRTPLTSLLAYLEIIERKKYADEEQMQNLIHKSVRQTMRIKAMADKLFEYFWAYAAEWETADMETVDADELFQQTLGDYAYSLESKGMLVETEFHPVQAQIRMNTDLLQRVLDNLYSNLLKYAEPKEPIKISYTSTDQNILVSMSNGVRERPDKNDSTSIGLITCRRIVKYHRGCFTAAESEGRFYVTLSLPLQE